ncbi:MAG TPA: hypothetical protein PK511_10070 [Chitinophagales bacterium]|nr:hypothetical protein [Chitinophagales bacterium]
MEKITKLVHSLSNREVKLFYKYNALSGKKTNNLKIRLFEIAKQNPEISDIEAAKILGKKVDAAFSMLKHRLQEDIYRILVFSVDESKFYSKTFKARYEVFKLLAQSTLLDSRNLKQLSTEAIQKADRIAQEYELLSSRVIINEILINSHQAAQGFRTYNKFKETVFSDISKQQALATGQDLFKQLIVPNMFAANRKKSQAEIAKNSAEQLEQLNKIHPSVRLNFLLLRSQMEYAEITQDFQTYYNTASEFLKLVTNNPPVSTSDNIGGANMLLAESSLRLHNWDNSKIFINESEKYFFKNSNNYITLMSIKYSMLVQTKSYEDAYQLVQEIRQLKSIKRGSFQYSKWIYYEANIKFLQGDFQGSMNLLKRHSFLKSDKSGWRIGFKILEMLCIIEIGHYDWLPYRLETFRKLLKDISKENVSRPTLIHKILLKLTRENFDFSTTDRKTFAELNLLRTDKGEYYRDPISYEIIPFDTWWDDKMATIKNRKKAE